MRVSYGFDQISTMHRPVATIGSFDGVHQGHRKLLQRLDQLATACEGERTVITFSPHPRQVLEADQTGLQLLNTLPEKIILLEQCGIDHLIVVNFTPKFSQLSFSDFIEHELVERLHIHTLLVGFNHHLGHNKAGNFESMKSLSERCGFCLEMMPQQLVEGEKVSSTVVRELLLRGEISRANRDLGALYLIMGDRQTDGSLHVSIDKLLPPPGSYPVELSSSTTRLDTPNRTLTNTLHVSPNRTLTFSESLVAENTVTVRLK